jgi:hypothetical protein
MSAPYTPPPPHVQFTHRLRLMNSSCKRAEPVHEAYAERNVWGRQQLPGQQVFKNVLHPFSDHSLDTKVHMRKTMTTVTTAVTTAAVTDCRQMCQSYRVLL